MRRGRRGPGLKWVNGGLSATFVKGTIVKASGRVGLNLGRFAVNEGRAFPQAPPPGTVSQDLELAIREAIGQGRLLLTDLEMRISYACHVISGLARHLGSLPGRKNVLFYSEGYPLDPGRLLGQIIAQRAAQESVRIRVDGM